MTIENVPEPEPVGPPSSETTANSSDDGPETEREQEEDNRDLDLGKFNGSTEEPDGDAEGEAAEATAIASPVQSSAGPSAWSQQLEPTKGTNGLERQQLQQQQHQQQQQHHHHQQQQQQQQEEDHRMVDNPIASMPAVTNSTIGPITQAPSATGTAGVATPATSTATATPITTIDNGTTTVDGQGMWRSWTRVFAKPESACLDLLDNCFDAALKPDFHGKVSLESASSFLFIRNNSSTPIRRLDDALTVFRSSKNAELIHNRVDGSSLFGNSSRTTTTTTTTNQYQYVSSNSGSVRTDDDPASRKDAIGENGVGLKHGCATLSDCSVIVTRNKDVVEIGFVCRQLQTPYGVNLPSFSFLVSKQSSMSQVTAESLKVPISQWLQSQKNVREAVQAALRADFRFKDRNVEDTLTEWVLSLWSDKWKDEDYIFLLVLCNLKKNAAKKADGIIFHSLIPVTHQQVAASFLKQIKTMLPEFYINLPSSGRFDFLIDQERVEFSYWQRRLVELTKFYVHVPMSTPFESLPEHVWIQGGEEKYPLSLYCGFDAQRVKSDADEGIGTSPLRLYIYSCQAGRLIQMEKDARFILGMSTSGVDYCQGLTVIINDIEGKLPLTPTKDGIAWSERPHGDIHRQNLHAWAGAVTHLYWQYHRSTFTAKGGNFSKSTKEYMKSTIQSFAMMQDKFDCSTKKFGAIEEGTFTEWTDIPWKRVEPKCGTLWTIRKQQKSTFYITTPPGVDTLFLFSQALSKKTSTKRKSSSIAKNSGCNQESFVDNDDHSATQPLDGNTSDDQNGDNDSCTASGRERRRRKRVDYKKLENQYSSLHFERRIQTKPNLTKGGRPINKSSMQKLEDQLDMENLRRMEAEADRDVYKMRMKELQKQLAAQKKLVQKLQGKSCTNIEGIEEPLTCSPSGAAETISDTNRADATALRSSTDRLETTDEKESRLAVGDVVYCQWPDSLMYYWATVIKITKPTKFKKYEYRVEYDDGDRDTVDASMIHRHDEAIRLMNEGKISKNLPPTDWLESVTMKTRRSVVTTVTTAATTNRKNESPSSIHTIEKQGSSHTSNSVTPLEAVL